MIAEGFFHGKFKRIGKNCGIVYARGRIEIFKRRFQTDFYFCEFNWEITIFCKIRFMFPKLDVWFVNVECEKRGNDASFTYNPIIFINDVINVWEECINSINLLLVSNRVTPNEIKRLKDGQMKTPQSVMTNRCVRFVWYRKCINSRATLPYTWTNLIQKFKRERKWVIINLIYIIFTKVNINSTKKKRKAKRNRHWIYLINFIKFYSRIMKKRKTLKVSRHFSIDKCKFFSCRRKVESGRNDKQFAIANVRIGLARPIPNKTNEMQMKEGHCTRWIFKKLRFSLLHVKNRGTHTRGIEQFLSFTHVSKNYFQRDFFFIFDIDRFHHWLLVDGKLYIYIGWNVILNAIRSVYSRYDDDDNNFRKKSRVAWRALLKLHRNARVRCTRVLR